MASIETQQNGDGSSTFKFELKQGDLVPGSDLVTQAITFLVVAASGIEFDGDQLTERGLKNARSAQGVAEMLELAAMNWKGPGE